MTASVKVSVSDLDSQKTILYNLDFQKGLDENVKEICELLEKPATKDHLYGLILYSNNSGEYINVHLSEDNFHQIKDGFMLKLGFSISYYNRTINESMKLDGSEEDVKKGEHVCRQLLNKLWADEEFIKYIAKHNTHEALMDYFTKTTDTSDRNEASVPYLKTIGHLFQKNFVNELRTDFTEKLLEFTENADTCNDALIYTLSIVHKILSSRDKFKEHKESIVTRLTFEKLTPYLWHEERPDLQYGALLAINTLIRVCKPPKKDDLIKQISAENIKQTIYKHIVQSRKKDDRIGQELYVYQTYLLSQFSGDLSRLYNVSEIAEGFKVAQDAVVPEYCAEFHDAPQEELAKNVDDVTLHPKGSLRFSLASLGSDDTFLSADVNFRLSTILQGDGQDFYVNHLTHRALMHYKNHYENHYLQSYIEEETFEPGILKTSEIIMQILVNTLHIGQDPVKGCTLYQPTIFSNPISTFVFELFARCMYLLAKTRREMRASSIDDYYKVVKVLEKQILIVLEQNPIDFKSVTDKIQTVSYKTVEIAWQKEKEAQMKLILEKNPCVLSLKREYTKVNEGYVAENRVNFLIEGAVFKKVTEKKQQNFVHVCLHKNRRHLLVSDFEPQSKKKIDTKVKEVAEISHIISGKGCPHAKILPIKDVDLSLTIIIDSKETLNFVTADKKALAYWTDGLNILTEKPHRSEFYSKELEELVKMDLLLHLIELQEAKIPNKAPPVPTPPVEKPKIAKKPLHLIIKS